MKILPLDETTKNEHEAIPGGVDRHDHVECWSIPRLMALVPGSTRRTWYAVLIPALLDAGALRRHGRRWYGRATTIEAAVMGRVEISDPLRHQAAR
jgi:hypothetical protein